MDLEERVSKLEGKNHQLIEERVSKLKRQNRRLKVVLISTVAFFALVIALEGFYFAVQTRNANLKLQQAVTNAVLADVRHMEQIRAFQADN